jgi:Family of unknown function (DUF5723)
MRFSALWGFVILLINTSVQAQNLLGLTTSRYGGTHRTYLNPALSADQSEAVFVNVAVANIHANNNAVRYQAPFSLLRLITGTVPEAYKNADGSVQFQDDYTADIQDGKAKNIIIQGELRGPAIGLRLGQQGTLTISTRLRAIGQINGISEQLSSALRASLANSTFYSIPSRDNQFGVNTNTFAEAALTYARTITETDGMKISAGATIKFLKGYTAGHLLNNGLDYQVLSDPNRGGTPYLLVTQFDADLAFTNYLQGRAVSAKTLFSADTPGSGIGADVGVTVLKQDDESGPAWLFGLSLTDLGGLNYTGESYAVTQKNVRFNGRDFDSINGVEAIAEVFRQKFNLSTANSRGSFKAGLPTALNLSADYQATSMLGVSFVWRQDMHGLRDAAVHQSSLLAITPRLESRLLGVAVPLLYINRSFTAGLALRVGPLRIGSDNLLGLVGSGRNGIRPRGMDVYAGLCFGIGQAKTR